MPATNPDSRTRAEALRRLHQGPKALLLPNVWDVASARIVEDMGFPAIATTSAGIANMLGYPDSQRISRDEMLAVVESIVRAVRVPVTADMEAGYASTSEEMCDTAAELIATGAVGLNLEDSGQDEATLIDLELQLEKINTLREAASDLGVPLVLNARTDAYWWKGNDPKTRMAETVKRANAFRAAGADCIFVPGLRTREEIAEFLRESPGPLNILGGPGVPSIPELEQLGVRRVSIGSGGYRSALGLLRRIATELRETGSFQSIAEFGIPFQEVGDLLLGNANRTSISKE